MTDDAMAPTRADRRIDTLDLLRGVAICGILLMNIPLMGLLGEAESPALPFVWNADWIAWIVQSALFEGTMRGLFTLLFGAGMLLMLRRAEGPEGSPLPIDVWTRRCFALMALGVAQWAVLIWPGEILFDYGLTGLFLLAFRTARPRTLLMIAALLLGALSLQSGLRSADRIAQYRASIPAAAAQKAGKALTEEQQKALDLVAEARQHLHPPAADLAKEKVERTHLPSLLGWSWRLWSKYNLEEPSWWQGMFESGAFMLIGMALFRMGVLQGGASRRTYVLLALIGYGGGFGMRAVFLAYGAHNGYDINPAGIVAPLALFRSAGYEAARLLITLGHLGLIVSLFQAGALGRAWPARALGRMALTTYSLESILTSLLFYGLGLVGSLGFLQLMGVAAAIWIVCGLFCVWWLRRRDQGPAEALLRAMAYGGLRSRRAGVAETLAIAPAL